MAATVEATTSVFFAFVIGFVVVIGAGAAAYLSVEEQGLTWVLPAGLALAAAEVASLVWLKWGLEGTVKRHRVPELALCQPRWPLPLRLPVALWWIAHAGISLGAMWLLEQGLGSDHARIWRSPLLWAALVFGLFTISHTTHLYVMMGMAAVRRSERAISFWWRHRFLVDALFVAATLLLPSRRL